VSRFPGLDFVEIDALLSEEERMVRDTVRAFVDDRGGADHREAHQEARFPIDLVPEMGELGFFGATISDYGLPGLNNVAYGLIMQELERGDSGLRSFVSVQSALVMYPIDAFGSQEQRDRWIPRLASGEAIGCFGLTEPDFGSNPGGMRPRRGATATPGCSTARSSGSPTARSPTSPWSGRRPTTACAASWSSAARRASPPSTSRASLAAGLGDLRARLLRTAASRPTPSCPRPRG
jgi:hypothetical protein